MSVPKGLLLLTICSTACGPLVPLTYVNPPPANSTNYNQHYNAYKYIENSLVQTIDSDDLTVSMEYMASQHEHYIFDLEVINNSSETVWLAPQSISYYASPKFFATLNDRQSDVHTVSAPNSRIPFSRLYACSPEAVKKIYRAKVQNAQSLGIFLLVLGAGLSIYDAAKDSEDSRKESWTRKNENRSLGRDLLVTAALTASDLAVQSSELAKEDLSYLPYELFPECKIEPGASVRGKVFVPICSSFRYSRIVVPVSETDFVFDFRRRGAKPGKVSNVRLPATLSQSPHHPLTDVPHR